jgi:hypothetical protein
MTVGGVPAEILYRSDRFGTVNDKVHDELLQLTGISVNGWHVTT